tara:strand:+ start:15860 stop:16681 length:822 start_codon:yes stop_codon:yes gene_type:complete
MENLFFWYFILLSLFLSSYLSYNHTTITKKIPFSPLFGKLKIGGNYLSEYDLISSPNPCGEIDDITILAGPNFDPSLIHHSIKDFYEQTSSYILEYQVFWHHPFKTGAFLTSYLTSYMEQLNLPGHSGIINEMKSKFVYIPSSMDPRDGTRAWIRTNNENETVFVALYATHKKKSTTYVNIAAPLPFSNLSTVLNVKNLKSGIELNTRPFSSDGGIYLVTAIGAIALPMSQRFQVLPFQPPLLKSPSETIVATHEMWLFGLKFLTISYTANKI